MTPELQGSENGFRWRGQVTLAVTNPDIAPLQRVWVRTWGNGRGGCSARAVTITAVSGAVAGAATMDCTAVPLDLALPLPPGARGAVEMDVDIRVPNIVDRFGRGAPRMALLSNALPVLAHRENRRWRLDRFFGGGEAWTYPAADSRVRLTPPAGVQVAAPGVLQADGARTLSRGRDYSWAAGRLRSLRGTVDGVAVAVWAPRSTPRSDLAQGLRLARRRLPTLARLFGAYGWPDLQVVLTDAAGMEHTALVMTSLEDFVFTHELAHEWWFALIGDDQAKDPWLDEGFSTWAEAVARGRPVRCPPVPGLARRRPAGSTSSARASSTTDTCTRAARACSSGSSGGWDARASAPPWRLRRGASLRVVDAGGLRGGDGRRRRRAPAGRHLARVPAALTVSAAAARPCATAPRRAP